MRWSAIPRMDSAIRVDPLDKCLPIPAASPAMGHRGTCPPRLPTISFIVPFGVNLTANYPNIV